MTTKRSNASQPTWGSWLRDGAQLIGLDDAQREKLKTQAREVADKAAEGIENLEQGIQEFEAKAKQQFDQWRQPKP